jgi:hypothetical protein
MHEIEVATHQLGKGVFAAGFGVTAEERRVIIHEWVYKI